MFRKIEELGDRLVNLVVPKATAGACVCGPADNYYEFCYCSPNNTGMPYYRLVQFSCTCKKTVGPCQKRLTDICT